ncbi:ParA family protein [Arthrobacter gengyunqii]|uniref:ParA family protein n=1 Tax=Arthrobacter gengyunqii TaxID=2886940 RepID=UPI0022B19F13|nr:ParA family protein [Arthrobacter gengyunqii]
MFASNHEPAQVQQSVSAPQPVIEAVPDLPEHYPPAPAEEVAVPAAVFSEPPVAGTEIVSRETTSNVVTPQTAADLSAGPEAIEGGVSDAAVTPSMSVDVMDLMDESTPLARELAHENRRREKLRGRVLPRPAETRIMTVSNQKGGVGKTTTTVNLAAALASAGLNVLVIDIDPQGNASTALGIDHRAEVESIYDVLIDDLPLANVVAQCPDISNLICAPATIHLAGAEIELVSLVAREQRLRRAIEAYAAERERTGQERLDYIFIDCPPSLGLLTVNAFVAAREVLIPIQCEYYALEGLSQLLKNIEMIQKHLNADLVVSTILLTMYDGRTNLAAQVAAEVREHFPEQVLGAVVPRSVRISEAPSYQQTVMTYDPSSSGALSYLEAAAEIAQRG